MSDVTTPFYGLTEPTLGEDPWGALINADLVSIDKFLALPQPAALGATLVTGTATLDLSKATIWTYTLGADTTFAFSNVPTGAFATSVLLVLTNGAAHVVTWPTVTWLAGPPTLKTAAVDVLRFWTVDNGTTWYAEQLSNSRTRVLTTVQALSTVATSDASLTSYSLPAGSLSVNGQAVRVTILGRYVGSNNGNLHLKFGATDVIAAGSTGPTSNAWFVVTATITRTGATSQLANYGITLSTSTPASALAVAGAASPAETLANAITIDIRGSNTTGGTLYYDLVTIEFLGV